MGVPTSEAGYTIATTRRETTKVHESMWWQGGGGGESESLEARAEQARPNYQTILAFSNLLGFL
jgi:hypothetical protein